MAGPKRVKKLLTIGSILLCLALPARAAEGDPAPFDADLQRLAEILGSLQYLRAVCGANEGQKWRNEMQALIDAEAPNGERRRKIVASFNRGYRGFSADLSHLYAGRRRRNSPLSRRRRQNRPRNHRAIRQLGARRY